MNLINNKSIYGNEYFLRALSITKKYSWIKRMVRNDKIHNLKNKKEKQLYLKFITDLISCLNIVYKDNWDIELNKIDNQYELVPIVLFPKITLTNSQKENKVIKNLIISFHIRKNKERFFISELRGTKYFFTDIDFYLKYIHSHIETFRSNFYEAQKFCTGLGEAFKSLFNISESDDKNNIMYFLLSLESFVKWESLEGGTHIKMNNTFAENSYGEYCGYNIYIHLDDIEQLLNSLEKDIPIEFTVNNGKYEILDTKELNEYLKNCILNKTNFSQSYFVRQTGYRQYSRVENVIKNTDILKVEINDSDLPYIYIQGKKIELKVVKEKYRCKNEDYIIHPKFKKQFFKELERITYERVLIFNTNNTR